MIETTCFGCGRKVNVRDDAAGKRGKCPQCGAVVEIPSPPPIEHAPMVEPVEFIYCPNCGTKNIENNFQCTQCAFFLHGPVGHNMAADDNTLGGLIPYKNARALWAYYLGIFSLIPCVAIPLGIAALVLGLKGLKFANEHAESRGKAHAWAGIIIGSLTALANSVGVIIAIIAATTK